MEPDWLFPWVCGPGSHPLTQSHLLDNRPPLCAVKFTPAQRSSYLLNSHTGDMGLRCKGNPQLHIVLAFAMSMEQGNKGDGLFKDLTAKLSLTKNTIFLYKWLESAEFFFFFLNALVWSVIPEGTTPRSLTQASSRFTHHECSWGL